jgi:cytochrome P450
VTTTDQVELGDIRFWARPPAEREAAFRALREQDGLPFFTEWSAAGQPKQSGFWAVTRYPDVIELSRRPEDFCSGEGVGIPDVRSDVSEYFNSFISMDDPRHARLRRIVSLGFTPRALDRLKADVEHIAEGIVAEIAPRGVTS